MHLVKTAHTLFHIILEFSETVIIRNTLKLLCGGVVVWLRLVCVCVCVCVCDYIFIHRMLLCYFFNENVSQQETKSLWHLLTSSGDRLKNLNSFRVHYVLPMK